MNNVMISNWNACVKPTDTVIHLGDFCLSCDNHQLRQLRDQLNGTIFLLPGNHDYPSRLKNFDIIVLSQWREENTLLFGDLILSHRPLADIPMGLVNVHGHIHNHKSYGKHINVSVDATDFTPVKLEDIIERANKISKD
jgi:calcineurin-like phosphoesterase family protein